MFTIARNNRGFTLIELLVVIAISTILMGLVLYPVVKSFQMTRSATAMVESQDAARSSMENISRDLGEAMDILDWTSDEPIELPVLMSNGDVQYFKLPDAKIDFVLPKMMVHCNNPSHTGGEPRDFPRGDEALPRCQISTCNSTDVEVRPKLPLEQDSKVVRYFLGLRYNNPNVTDTSLPKFGWKSPWDKNTQTNEGNQVVLYRVEFDPTDTDLLSSEISEALLNKFGGDRVQANLADPQFFYHRDTWRAWAQKVRIMGVGKYEDLVLPIYNDVDPDRIDAMEPTVTFRYASIDNDTFTGTFSTDKSFEYPDAVPSVFRASYAYWLPDYSTGVYQYEYNDDGSVNTTTVYYTGSDGPNLVIYKKVYPDNTDPQIVFDITQYLTDGQITSNSSDAVEMAFTVDEGRGLINFVLDPRTIAQRNANEPVCTIDPARINATFKTQYNADRGSARRAYLLDTFNPSMTSVYLKYARIVPGSERVVGPNMTPGPAYGVLVQYERVPFTLGDPGLNQYKINYDTGELFFSPEYDQNLPEISNGANSYVPIRVDYRVQFNRDGDVVRGDYVTKSAITIHLGMRMFDPDAGKSHSVDLTNTVKVRNALR
ncbi:MAG: type II secretion system protein [Armatimonadota bacterium]|nr:type II secretion system GspH family protein [bacterium]